MKGCYWGTDLVLSEGLPNPADYLTASTLEKGLSPAGRARGRVWRHWLRRLVAGGGQVHAGPFLHLRQLSACFPGSGGGLGQRRRRAPLLSSVRLSQQLPVGSIIVRALTRPISQSRGTRFNLAIFMEILEESVQISIIISHII